MKNVAIILSLVTMMAGCVAETAGPESETGNVEEGAATDAEKVGTGSSALMACGYQACMEYCTAENSFSYCHPICYRDCNP